MECELVAMDYYWTRCGNVGGQMISETENGETNYGTRKKEYKKEEKRQGNRKESSPVGAGRNTDQ